VYKAYGSLCVFAINDDVADALCSAEILWKFMDPPLCVCKKILHINSEYSTVTGGKRSQIVAHQFHIRLQLSWDFVFQAL